MYSQTFNIKRNTITQSFPAPTVLKDCPTPWLLLWAGSGVTADASGAVTAWNDLSGNGRNFTLGSGTSPTLRGTREVEFNGTTTRLQSAAQTVPSNFSLIMITKLRQSSNFGTFFGNDAAGSLGVKLFGNLGYEILIVGNTDVSPSTAQSSIITSKKNSGNRVFSWRRDASVVTHYRESDLVSSDSLTATFTPTASVLNLGASSTAGAGAFTGSISFVGIWDGLSATDFQEILKTLTLPDTAWSF